MRRRTEDDRLAFGKTLAFTAAGFPSAVSLDAAAVATYYRVLQDVPLELLNEVAQTVLSTPREHFPSAPEWLEIANRLQRKHHEEQRQLVLAQRTSDYHCHDCNDTGWKRGERGVYPCPCRSTNPVWKANRSAPQFSIPRRTRHAPEEEDRRQLTDGKSRSSDDLDFER